MIEARRSLCPIIGALACAAMKTKILSILGLAVLTSGVFAGSDTYSGGKGGKVVTLPQPSCFSPGLDIGVFGGGFLPMHNHDGYKGALGGGVLVDYFFNNNLGIEFSYGAYATNGTQHLFDGDIILRAPIESVCIAPYLMVGGGFHVDGSSQGEYHAGAGIEAKLKSMDNVGLFADGAYHWHSSGESDLDFTLVRIGMKFHF